MPDYIVAVTCSVNINGASVDVRVPLSPDVERMIPEERYDWIAQQARKIALQKCAGGYEVYLPGK